MPRFKTPPGVSVVWSPANRAWLVLWGRPGAQIIDKALLRVIGDEAEVRAYLAEITPAPAQGAEHNPEAEAEAVLALAGKGEP